MKRSILFLSIISALSIGSYADYVIVVNDKSNNYQVGGFTDISSATDWTFVSNNCSEDIQETDLYSGETATQTKTCTLIEEQYITIERTYDNGTTEIVSNERKERSTPTTTYPTITGIHLEDNCRDILAFNSSFANQDGDYSSNNGVLTCDMTTDGGGWTEIAHVIKEDVAVTQTYTVNIDDKGLDYNEVFYNDINSHSDFLIPRSNGMWYWDGLDVSKNMFKIGGKWRHVKSEFSAQGCDSIPEADSFSLSSYRFIEKSSVCLDGTTNKDGICGMKVVIDIPEGMSIDAFSDVETQSALMGGTNCTADNGLNYNFKLYVR